MESWIFTTGIIKYTMEYYKLHSWYDKKISVTNELSLLERYEYTIEH